MAGTSTTTPVTIRQVRGLRRWLQTSDFEEVERARIRQAFGDHLNRAELRLRGVMDEPAPEDAAEAALAATQQLLAFAAELGEIRPARRLP